MRLSTLAKWNQTEADWMRLLELYPETCYLFRNEGKITGSGSLASYGRNLAWIGMILVDPEFRGRGFGNEIFELRYRKHGRVVLKRSDSMPQIREDRSTANTAFMM